MALSTTLARALCLRTAMSCNITKTWTRMCRAVCSSSRTLNPAIYPRRPISATITNCSEANTSANGRKMGSVGVQANADENARMLRVTMPSGKVETFPYVWLRDSCQCSLCHQPSSQSRSLLMADLNIDVLVSNVQVNGVTGDIQVTWDDGHVSTYQIDWLKERTFNSEARRRRVDDTYLKAGKTLWGTELNGNIPRFDFTKVISGNEHMYQFLETIRVTGLAVIYGAPEEKGAVTTLGNAIFHIRPCNYGDTFQVYTRPDPKNAAYTAKALELHLDLGYFDYIPGVQFLHCIKQSSMGGTNQFADGYYAAEQIRKSNPDAFKLLAETLVDFHDKGHDEHVGDYHQKSRGPTILRDSEGNYIQVRISNHGRCDYLNTDAERVSAWYKAYLQLYKSLYSQDNMVEYKMEPGEIVCIDNFRVLHGRSTISADFGDQNKLPERHLEGTYVDWDGWNSKIRTLRQELGQ